MPQSFTYLEDGGVLRTGEGQLTFADVASVNAALYATPEKIRKIAYQLSDYARVTDVDITIEEVMELSRADQATAKLNPDMIVAVVGQDDVMFGLLRMWELLAGEDAMKAAVFRDMEEAREWIKAKLAERKA